LGNALENLSVATVNYSEDAVQRGKNEGKLADALLLAERRKLEQKGSEGGDAEDSKKRAAVANKNASANAKEKSAPATVVKLKRTAGTTWVGITGAGRDVICMKRSVY